MMFPLIFGCLGLFVFWYKFKSRRDRPFPPGPPADPFIGHLRCMPHENHANIFYEWGKTYGDVLYLHVMGRSIVILNSAQVAVDLLEKRSSIYSDRPKFTFYKLLGLAEYNIGLMRYGRQFQRHRRMVDQYWTEKRCLTYRPVQTREARVLLQGLLSDAAERQKLIQRFSEAIIMRLAFGHQISSNNIETDPYVRIVEDAGLALNNSGPPDSNPIDLFPPLQYLPLWFPGTFYVNYARKNRPTIEKLRNYPFEQMEKQMAEGNAKPSFLSYNLETLNRDGDSYPNTADDIKGAAAAIHLAGSDTTAASLSIFILAMILNPECQARAQKEIDAVVGSERLPEFEDRGSLPYIDCLLRETLRWNISVPLGVPHCLMEDDIYKGMLLPKGSTVIANIRAMTLDDRVYNNPHQFKPSRFLPKPEGDGEVLLGGPFGFGRRICPGRHLADASLWIGIVSILATFNISKAVGNDGQEITPNVAFSPGLSSHPLPFQCQIRVRNEAARRLIIQADVGDNY